MAREGYCPHGVYVGGIGVDWMCGRCEDGDPSVIPNYDLSIGNKWEARMREVMMTVGVGMLLAFPAEAHQARKLMGMRS
jgi:hypothetical protein